jgi:hypothetical protein
MASDFDNFTASPFTQMGIAMLGQRDNNTAGAMAQGLQASKKLTDENTAKQAFGEFFKTVKAKNGEITKQDVFGAMETAMQQGLSPDAAGSLVKFGLELTKDDGTEFSKLLKEQARHAPGSPEYKAYAGYIAQKGVDPFARMMYGNQLKQGNESNPSAFLNPGAPSPAPAPIGGMSAPQGLDGPYMPSPTPVNGPVPPPPAIQPQGNMPGVDTPMGPLSELANQPPPVAAPAAPAAPAPQSPAQPSAADMARMYEDAADRALATPGGAKEAADLRSQAAMHRLRADAETKASGFNESQGTAAGYADRMIEAEKRLGQQVADGYSAGNLKDAAAAKLPGGNYLLDDKAQVYKQGQEDWVRAKLRKESGAVIAQEEMANEIKTFFPQPGDSQKTVVAKAQARRVATEGMKRMAGPGYNGAKSQPPGGKPGVTHVYVPGKGIRAVGQ